MAEDSAIVTAEIPEVLPPCRRSRLRSGSGIERMDQIDGRLSGALDSIRRVEAGLGSAGGPGELGSPAPEWFGLQLRAAALHDRGVERN